MGQEKKDESNKTLSDVKKTLKDIQVRAAKRKAEIDMKRAAANEARKKRMANKPSTSGSSIKGLQGLQPNLGSKIIK
jgi:hypothetical protein